MSADGLWWSLFFSHGFFGPLMVFDCPSWSLLASGGLSWSFWFVMDSADLWQFLVFLGGSFCWFSYGLCWSLMVIVGLSWSRWAFWTLSCDGRPRLKAPWDELLPRSSSNMEKFSRGKRWEVLLVLVSAGLQESRFTFKMWLMGFYCSTGVGGQSCSLTWTSWWRTNWINYCGVYNKTPD